MEQGIRREMYKTIMALTGPSSALGSKVDNLAGTYVNRLNGSALAGAATIPAATTAGGGTLVVWMCIAPILASGLYDVRLSAAVTGVTATDTIDWGVSTDYATTFPAVTGGKH